MKPVVFLDRDGTIIEEVGYLRHPEEVKLLPRVPEALRLLKEAGLALVVITNQSGIARGYFDEETLARIHERLKELLAEHGVELDGIYYCPHHPEEGCSCRKPKTDLAERAAKERGLDLKRAFVVGDRDVDVALGKNLGATSVLVLTGYGRRDLSRLLHREGKALACVTPDIVAEDLWQAAQKILSRLK